MDIVKFITDILPYVIAVLTMVITILGWIIHRKTERIKIIENQLSEKKHEAYAEIVQLFYDVLQDIRSGKSFDNEDAEKRMMRSKRDILMYGSDKVFKAFNQYLCATTQNSDPMLPLKNFLKLILEIRKDMCGKKTSVKEKDILLSLMQSEEEVKKLRKLYK